MDSIKVGKIVRQQREVRGLTQEEFMKISGIGSIASLWKVEFLYFSPSIILSCRIAIALGLEIDNFISLVMREKTFEFTKKNIQLFKCLLKRHKKKPLICEDVRNQIKFDKQEKGRKGKYLVTLPKTGKFIQNKRIEKGLYLRQLSEICGVCGKKISAIENATANLSYLNIIRLAEGLNILYMELFHMQLMERIKCHEKFTKNKVEEFKQSVEFSKLEPLTYSHY